MSMADRIAVLDRGCIQQVGTPTDIYQSPANILVANFIGNPSINLIPCNFAIVDESTILTLIGKPQIEIKDKRIAHALNESSVSSKLILGVHPEDVVVSSEQDEGSIAAEVYGFEPLGAETIVDILLGKNEDGTDVIVKARTAPTHEARIGQKIWMSFVPERIHLFDNETGEALV